MKTLTKKQLLELHEEGNRMRKDLEARVRAEAWGLSAAEWRTLHDHVVDERDALQAKLDEMTERADRAETQLAGCGVAALGATSESHVAKKGDWGWSASYGDVLTIRRQLDALRAAIEPTKENVNVVKDAIARHFGSFCDTDAQAVDVLATIAYRSRIST